MFFIIRLAYTACCLSTVGVIEGREAEGRLSRLLLRLTPARIDFRLFVAAWNKDSKRCTIMYISHLARMKHEKCYLFLYLLLFQQKCGREIGIGGEEDG